MKPLIAATVGMYASFDRADAARALIAVCSASTTSGLAPTPEIGFLDLCIRGIPRDGNSSFCHGYSFVRASDLDKLMDLKDRRDRLNERHRDKSLILSKQRHRDLHC